MNFTTIIVLSALLMVGTFIFFHIGPKYFRNASNNIKKIFVLEYFVVGIIVFGGLVIAFLIGSILEWLKKDYINAVKFLLTAGLTTMFLLALIRVGKRMWLSIQPPIRKNRINSF